MPAAFAQTWPAKTVRIVVPQPPGGTTDLLARLLAKKYTEVLGQPFVVENRAGASGIIGTEVVVRSAGGRLHAALRVRIAFGQHRDLWFEVELRSAHGPGARYLAVLGSAAADAASRACRSRSVKELIALSKRQKGGLNGGHNGSGTTSHIALEMFKQQTGANVVAIPYKGGGPATIAILAGEIDFTFGTLSTVKPHVEGGRLRGIAVSTKKRSSVFPDLPTMDSIYPGFESDNWFGLFAPAGVPKEIIARLNTLAIEAMKSAEIRDVIAKDGGDIVGSTPEELGAHLKSEVARYSKVIKAGNIKAE